MRRIEARQLLTEDVQVDVGRGEHDIAELAAEVGTAGNGVFPQRFHGEPGAHRMRENMHAANNRQFGKPAQELAQGIAGNGRAFLGCAIVEEAAGGGPCIEHRNAAKTPVVRDLREPETRLVVARVKTMYIEQNIAVRSDASGNMASEPGGKSSLVQAAPAPRDKVFLRIFRTEGGPLHRALRMARRHADHLQRKPRPVRDGGFARRAAFALAGRDHEYRDGPRLRGRLARPGQTDGRAAGDKDHGAAREHVTKAPADIWSPREQPPAYARPAISCYRALVQIMVSALRDDRCSQRTRRILLKT